MGENNEAIAIQETDGYPLAASNPYFNEHLELTKLLNEAVISTEPNYYVKVHQFPAGKAIMGAAPSRQIAFILAALERYMWLRRELLDFSRRRVQLFDELTAKHEIDHRIYDQRREEVLAPYRAMAAHEHVLFNSVEVMSSLVAAFLRRSLPFTSTDLIALIPYTMFERKADGGVQFTSWLLPGLIGALERFAGEQPIPDDLRTAILTMDAEMKAQVYGSGARDQRLDVRMRDLLGESPSGLPQPGEPWSDAALRDYNEAEPRQQAALQALFAHCSDSMASKPSGKWIKTAEKLIADIGHDAFAATLERYVRLFTAHAAPVKDYNTDLMKGLIWCAPAVERPSLRNAIADAVPSCLKTLYHPQQVEVDGAVYDCGTNAPRAPRIANAIIWALSAMSSLDAVSQLSRVRMRVRNGSVLKTVERALTEIATRLAVSPEELEELAVPDFGLQDGVLNQTFGEWNAAIDFNSGKGLWTWSADGKQSPKSVPAAVKNEFAAEFKELKSQVAEIEKLLPVQKQRIDLLMRDEKTWSFAVWQQRYQEHSFVSLVSSFVIWEWSDDNRDWHAFLPLKTGWIGEHGEGATPPIGEDVTIRLWHPIQQSLATVVAWRTSLENKKLRQPFKQAHREVYLLTDAERQTAVYSNRFAAHIVRQHQFNALCGLRGWKNKLRLLVDDSYPPATKEIPRYNLRVEFWIEGIGDVYSVDTTDTGSFLRLATDQVRFYHLDAAPNESHARGGGYAAGFRGGYRAEVPTPLPLAEIPPLIFSELMRDVDLFVGVASVGNDPTWADGGPEGRFVDYWQHFSFGELSATAQTRGDLLSRLLPKLKIAKVCRLEGRFLHVAGKRRQYKIHLGSGNILMEPNDHYLCIVPSRGMATEGEGGRLFLPFEGDSTLSIILSKAFMLAEDDKIKDQSILSQIGTGK